MSYEALELSIHGGAPVECYAWDSVGGTIIRDTSADEPITLSGVGAGVYQTTYIERGPLRESVEDDSGSVEVKVHPSHPAAAAFVGYPPAVPIELTIYRKHRDDAEVIVMPVGRVARCTFDRSDKGGMVATLLVVPGGPRFVRNLPLLSYQSPCNWVLYGPGCRLDKEDFRISGTAAFVAGVHISATAFASRPDGWFRSGWAETAAGERRAIVAHVADALTLVAPFDDLDVGDAIHAYAGCDRTETTCATHFNNLVNHLGFPDIPTRDPYRWSLDG